MLQTIYKTLLFSPLLLLLLIFSSATTHALEKQMVRIGLLAYEGADTTIQRWQPTVDHLNSKLPEYFFTIVPVDINTLNNLVANNLIDYTLTNGVQFLKYKYSFKAVRMLNLEPQHGTVRHAIGSVLIGRIDEPELQSWNQITDRTIISTTEQAFGGFRVLLREMMSQSVSFDELKKLRFIGLPQQSLFDKVINKQADFAILPTCLFERSLENGSIKPGTLKVLMKKQVSDFTCQTSSKLYPNWTFARMDKVDINDAKKLASTLLAVNSDSEMAIQGRYKGWSIPVDDSSIYQLMNDLGEDVSPSTLGQLFKKYQGALLVGLAFVLAFLAFHFRVNYLVKIRSAQLRNEINQHKETADRLEVETKQLFKAQRILLTGEMAAGIAHELNQPLMAIATFAASCRRRLSKPEIPVEDITHGLKRIEEQTKSAKGIIDRMRNFMKVNEISLSEHNVRDLIHDLVKTYKNTFDELGISCNVNIDNTYLKIDPILTQQILANLIQNSIDAIKSTSTKHGVIDIYSEISDLFILSIKDNGIGMTAKQLDNLFMPFNSTKKNGLGLGMVICKRIIEMSNATIEAKPLEQGCLIQIKFPLESNEETL